MAGPAYELFDTLRTGLGQDRVGEGHVAFEQRYDLREGSRGADISALVTGKEEQDLIQSDALISEKVRRMSAEKHLPFLAHESEHLAQTADNLGVEG